MIPDTQDVTVQSESQFQARLCEVGESRYPLDHPFHVLLHGGELDREQVRGWVINLHYHQIQISRRDALLMSRIPDPELRRAWRQRIADHDGKVNGPIGGALDESGGLGRWMRLVDALGLSENDGALHDGGFYDKLLPGTRFAVDAHFSFIQQRPLLEAIASTLTDLFETRLISDRIPGLLTHYSFITPESLAYFEKRIDHAPRDAKIALDYVLSQARTLDQQQAACQALAFGCDVLTAQLDALHHAYLCPGETRRAQHH